MPQPGNATGAPPRTENPATESTPQPLENARRASEQNKVHQRSIDIGDIFSDTNTVKLCEAARDGDLDVVNRLVNAGVDIHVRGKFNTRPLYIAACNGRWDITRRLLELGADPNVCCTNESEKVLRQFANRSIDVGSRSGPFIVAQGESPMHLIAWGAGPTESADLLTLAIKHGGNVNLPASGPGKETPLHMAVFGSNHGNIQTLVKSGADVNSKNGFGRTPLETIGVRDPEAAWMLLENGAIYDASVVYPMDEPKKYGFLASIVIFYDDLLRNQLDPENDPALQEQITSFWKVAQRLKKDGVDLDRMQKRWHAAQQPDRRKLARELSRKMIGPIFSDPKVVELCAAINDGDLEWFNDVVASGVEFKAVGKLGLTPLHFATFNFRSGIFKRLLELGADPNARCTMASPSDLKEIAPSGPAGFLVYSQWGVAPIHIVAQNAGANSEGDLLALTIKSGGNVNLESKGASKSTPLHMAVSGCKYDNIRTLIKAGANVNVKNAYGQTPLDTIHNCDPEAALVLLENGARYDRSVTYPFEDQDANGFLCTMVALYDKLLTTNLEQNDPKIKTCFRKVAERLKKDGVDLDRMQKRFRGDQEANGARQLPPSNPADVEAVFRHPR